METLVEELWAGILLSSRVTHRYWEGVSSVRKMYHISSGFVQTFRQLTAAFFDYRVNCIKANAHVSTLSWTTNINVRHLSVLLLCWPDLWSQGTDLVSEDGVLISLPTDSPESRRMFNVRMIGVRDRSNCTQHRHQ